ncbi:hypothetical protein SDRG_11136 [Saprolegnia diclina VS20]|uniref:Uncharacterized protein n=1 Tax=Saprolegnia diclina (strain VS20) TaxID=1156394 RepID=T0RG04_SAPDV|nr:hypothetical protein SDRG_11136 [Saprolegnia diclina VS20]EQC31213.1 hypothetical protein SDRG_11136 [Saprolegnia diclina VS20]|eukprot:XP_008615386.1 hypothetical protein SDRG_11136 [Saprolegnia diclina VS20]
MSGFRLQPHEILRDPTKDELYNGPTRQKLPVAVQKMDEADTACTFCGVSYFVFAEVQELQQTAKVYRRQFESIVQWMRVAKTQQQTMKAEMLAFQHEHAATVVAITSQLQGFLAVEQKHMQEKKDLQQQLSVAHASLRGAEAELTTQRNLILDEANRRVGAAEKQVDLKTQDIARLEQQMVEALRDAAHLHESSQMTWQQEKATLMAQIDTAKSTLASHKLKADAEIARLEGVIATQDDELRAALATSAQLQARVDGYALAAATAKHELQHVEAATHESLAAVQAELAQTKAQLHMVQDQLVQAHAAASRTVAEAEVERADVRQLHEDIAKWKHQATALEKNKVLLLAERTTLKQEIASADDRLHEVKGQIRGLQSTIDEQARTLSSHAAEHKAAMDRVKLEWSKEIAELKSNHAIALDGAATSAKEEIDRLGLELQQLHDHVRHIKLATSIAEKKADDCDRALKDAKQRAASYMEELQSTKMGHQHVKSSLSALERKLRDLEGEKNIALQERDGLQQALERKQIALDKNAATSLHEKETSIQRLQADIQQYKRTVEQLEAALQDARSAPRHAKSSPKVDKSPSNQESSGNVQRLTELLSQKDQEIALLQQTVHRECMERTSMLEKMRSAKILPDNSASTSDAPSYPEDDDTTSVPTTGLASFYEKLRRTKKPPKAKK